MGGSPRQLVVAAILRRGATVLLCRRPLEKRHGGLWEFPGGKVHPGETPEQALARELGEELGLALTAVAAPVAQLDDPGSPFTIAFHPVEACGEPEAREHLEARWVEISRAADYDLAPSDRRLVDGEFLSRLPTAAARC
jgi:mutator protein MutT